MRTSGGPVNSTHIFRSALAAMVPTKQASVRQYSSESFSVWGGDIRIIRMKHDKKSGEPNDPRKSS
jgi:hypothetical protein